MVALVIFSMDRAMQLDSLLRSIDDNVRGLDKIVVIARWTSQLHEAAYRALAERTMGNAWISWMYTDQPGVSQQLAKTLEVPRVTHVSLAVDDMVFFAPTFYDFAAETLDRTGAFVWSWRIGHRLPAAVNFYRVGSATKLHWSCSALTGDRDYHYLFHTDGSLYQADELNKLLDKALPDWSTKPYIPNEVESACANFIDARRSQFGRHVGPIAQTCITWQLNKESTTEGRFGAPHCTIPETSLDALATAYLAGKRVNNSRLYAMNPFQFNPPGARKTHVHACEEASRFYASLIE